MLPATKRGWSITAPTEGQVVADAFDLERVERQAHLLDRLGAGRRPGAELGDHRVVEHADLAALEDAGVVAHDAAAAVGPSTGGR